MGSLILLSGLVMLALAGLSAIAWMLKRLFRPGWRQTTFVYCPRCCNELVDCVHSTCWHDGNGHVNYECADCGTLSCWDFDLPVPVLLWNDQSYPEWCATQGDSGRKGKG